MDAAVSGGRAGGAPRGAYPDRRASPVPEIAVENSLATARAILVGSAVLTLLIAAAIQQWVVAGILAVGVAAHTVHIVRLRRQQAATTSGDTLPGA